MSYLGSSHAGGRRPIGPATIVSIVILAALALALVVTLIPSRSRADQANPTIRVAKVILGPGDPTSVFDVSVDGGPLAPLVAGSPITIAVSEGNHTLTEQPEPSYVFVGYSLVPGTSNDFLCPATPQVATLNAQVPVLVDATNNWDAAVCLYNRAAASVSIVKVNDGGPAGDPFLASFTPPQPDGTDEGFSASAPFVGGLLFTGPTTITEQPKAGYTYQGWALGALDLACPPVAQAQPGPAQLDLVFDTVTVVCFYNQFTPPPANGTIWLRKVIASGVDPAQTYTAHIDGGPGITIGGVNIPPGQSVLLGVHTVTEDFLAGSVVKWGHSIVPGPGGDFICPATPQVLGAGPANVDVTAAQPNVGVCLYNALVPNLHIQKVSPDAPDGTMFIANASGPVTGSIALGPFPVGGGTSVAEPWYGGPVHVWEVPPPAGWTLVGYFTGGFPLVCPTAEGSYSLAEPDLTFTPATQAQTVCIMNKKAAAAPTGSVQIRKVNTGGPANDGFTADVTGGPQDVAFSQATPAVVNGLSLSQHTVTEDPKAGYTYTGWAILQSTTEVCPQQANETGDASVTITANTTQVICFYNTAVPTGSLQIRKVNNGGPDADVFTADVSGGGPIDIPFAEDTPQTVNGISAGNHTVTEDPAPGYTYDGWAFLNPLTGQCPPTPSAAGPAQVTITAGTTTSICLYNTPSATGQGTFKVVKVNKGGNPADTFEFHTVGKPPPGIPFSAINPYQSGIVVGPRTLAETLVLPGYTYKGYDLAFDLDAPCPADPTGTGDVSFNVVDGGEYRVCFYNEANGNIQVRKVNEGGPSGDIFTADVTGGPQNAPFSETNPGLISNVPAGPQTVTEDGKAGYDYLGWAFLSSTTQLCPPEPQFTGDAQVNVVPGGTVVVCFYNKPFARLVVQKIDLTTGHPTWHFPVNGPGGFFTIVDLPGGIGGEGATTTVKVPFTAGGLFTVSETDAGPATCPPNNQNPALYTTTQIAGAGGITLTVPDQVMIFTFKNEPCPVNPIIILTATPGLTSTVTPTVTPSTTPTPGTSTPTATRTPTSTTTPTSSVTPTPTQPRTPTGTATPATSTATSITTPGGTGTPGGTSTTSSGSPGANDDPQDINSPFNPRATPAAPSAGSGLAPGSGSGLAGVLLGLALLACVLGVGVIARARREE